MTKLNSRGVTCVEISFYKPEGFIDKWVVETKNRYEAFQVVMNKYNRDELKFINYIAHKLILPEKYSLITKKELQNDNSR